MKYKIFFALSFWVLIFAVSCNRDEISFDNQSQDLRFSTDTVFCDTVYNQVRSETYAVKVYNDEDKDILISRISLLEGTNSPYRINVDGKSGFEFHNVPLRRNDSMYIFVEIAPYINGDRFIAEDQILFDSPIGQQHLTLFSTIQDAEFFVESPTNPNIVSGNVTWTKDKVKLIYGDLTLSSGSTLNIEEGTFVYFTKNSGMKVESGATLNINGVLDSEVTIRGDRNEPKYDTVPKNWNAIEFEQGTSLNMNYARVYGGTNGLKLNETTANIQNSIIHTFEDYGVHAVNSNVIASNLVMNNCGDASFGIFKGGTYDFTHTTITNYWNYGISVVPNALFASNEYVNDSGQTETGNLYLNIKNSILYTGLQNAIVFHPVSGNTFSYSIQNCLFNHEENAAGFAFDGNPNIMASIKNENPLFLNRFIEMMNLRVESNSPANALNVANSTHAASVPFDIKNNPRTGVNTTLGAYQVQ